MAELLSLRGVCKSFSRGDRRLRVLEDVSLEVGLREIVVVGGARDEGKTTLLRVAAGIQRPDDGEVWLGGRDLTRLGDGQRSRLLGDEIAWTHRAGSGLRVEVRDFVGLPLTMGRRYGRRRVRHDAMDALERVGVVGCARQRWGDLSNWERVMVGLARGIVGRPRLMVVDDVIDGLGMSKTQEAGDLLRSLVDELGCGVLMSVSDLEAALVGDRVWAFTRGRLKLMSDQTAADADVIHLPVGARSSGGSRGAGS
jgi:predicted ABC-type transport system involved in lysophospholipase L1 biosynthesis ATPase subunit